TMDKSSIATGAETGAVQKIKEWQAIIEDNAPLCTFLPRVAIRRGKPMPAERLTDMLYNDVGLVFQHIAVLMAFTIRSSDNATPAGCVVIAHVVTPFLLLTSS